MMNFYKFVLCICFVLHIQLYAQVGNNRTRPSEVSNKKFVPQKVEEKSSLKSPEIRLTGKVKNEAGDNLVGAGIMIKGKDVGVVSDATGQFTINVKGDDTLVVTSLGMEDMEVPVRRQKRIYINMVPKLADLYGVNTILGSREPHTVGFDYEQFTTDFARGEIDFLDGLLGKTELQITKTSGLLGAGQRFKLRGIGSTLTDTPLLIVDGIPVGNDVFSAPDGVDLSTRIFDFNPNDIAQITILKSAAANTLYGTRGGNGAILLTTKRGRNGNLQIEYGSSIRFDFARNLPQKQTRFGFSSGSVSPGQNDNVGGSVPIFLGPNSWQPLAGNLLLGGSNPYNSSIPGIVDNTLFNGVAQGDQMKKMFGTLNFTQSHQVSVFGGKGRFKTFSSLSYTRMEPDPNVILNNGFTRFTFRFNGASELTDKISVDFSTYIGSLRARKTRKGYAGYTYSAYLLPINFEVIGDQLFDLFYNTNSITNNIWSETSHDLPSYIAQNVRFFENVNHFMASARFTYNFTKPNQDAYQKQEMFLTHRIGTDYSATKITQDIDERSKKNNYYLLANPKPGLTGLVFIERLRISSDLYFNYLKNFSNKHAIKVIGGASYSGNDVVSVTMLSAGRNVTAAGTSYSNSTVGDLPYQQHNFGLLARFDYAFRKLVFVNTYFRHDWNFDFYPVGGYGNHALGGNFYPGLDFAFLFTQLSKQNGKKGFGALSTGKLRFSAGMVGNTPSAEDFSYYSVNVSDPSEYNPTTFQLISSSVVANNFQIMGPNGSTYGYKNQKVYYPNDLKPETKYGFDLGIDLGFVEDRIIWKTTGFFEMLRGGFLLKKSENPNLLAELRNMVDVNTIGANMELEARAISNQKLDWTIGFNILWTTNKVVRVADGNTYIIADIPGVPGIANVVKEGEVFGAIYGTTWDLAEGETWSSTTKKKQEILGDPNPWFTLGLSNKFSFSGVDISFVLQSAYGGTMWNGTNQYMNIYGTGIDTEDRDQPNNVDVSGVTNSAQWNDAALEYYKKYGAVSALGIEKRIFWLKLRDVTISYTMNSKNPKSNLKSYQVYAQGKDLFLLSNYKNNLDPDIAMGANNRTYGLDFFGNPFTRAVTVGFRLIF